ncbi:hypothetical protein FRC08_012073 [Ceratobasidium sp. 394]|nr:hypothetical protein FRC08_012073 [Ceratobasidium sp. 394]KAG9093992.1 hypothetical protein FS749_013325 [Ceratobasidium sp. UAMH 11750]
MARDGTGLAINPHPTMFRSSRHSRATATAADGTPIVAPAPARSRWLKGHHSRNEQKHVEDLQATMNNPNTTSAERDQAQTELTAMGHGKKAHVPMSVKVKSMFRSNKAKRNAAATDNTAHV